MSATTANYLDWLGTQIEVVTTELREQAGPGFADAAAHLVDLMTARTMLREFIASQTPNTPANLTD